MALESLCLFLYVIFVVICIYVFVGNFSRMDRRSRFLGGGTLLILVFVAGVCLRLQDKDLEDKLKGKYEQSVNFTYTITKVLTSHFDGYSDLFGWIVERDGEQYLVKRDIEGTGYRERNFVSDQPYQSWKVGDKLKLNHYNPLLVIPLSEITGDHPTTSILTAKVPEG